MTDRFPILFALCCALGVFAQAAMAQDIPSSDRRSGASDDPFDAEESVGNCVSTRQISATHILDDRKILLEMREGADIVMHLKYQCPQLKFHDYFSYESTLGQLCAELDQITTRAGFHCDIGGFSKATLESESEQPSTP
ncbi:hypothetical protein JCM17845_24960 [Iodidimonas gelatinilytica]|uniref:Uncharacterized protein n=1 Tax=Iodidimonas gelatinilytica TaxID=1236966 RepID=A0A5A7N0T3_9PROT|nr:DUF6491 family protein [Iodidimonas gelatinilytica]GER01873.1 hypothetical protein JCM17845_24960 [Iodidimonas gelatinilytica]